MTPPREDPEPAPDNAWVLQQRSLAEALIEIADTAEIPLTLPVGVLRQMVPHDFRATGKALGWTVGVIYDKGAFSCLAGFITPRGVRLPLFDWPEGRDRSMLLEWRPRG